MRLRFAGLKLQMTFKAPDDPPFSIARCEGKLVEARVFRLARLEDARSYAKALANVVADFPSSTRPILCADHRPVTIYSQDVADGLADLFSDMNTRLDRIAIIVAKTNATLLLQVERLVREAAFSNRRVFTTADQAAAHLAPSLGPAELDRLRVFLGAWRAT